MFCGCAHTRLQNSQLTDFNKKYVFCGCESVTIFRQRNVDNMSEHIFAEIIIKRPRSFACPSRCQQHRVARATARRAARHQAAGTRHTYIRRGANRKPHTYAFTRIRPHLQNCGAADAQRAPAVRYLVNAPRSGLLRGLGYLLHAARGGPVGV